MVSNSKNLRSGYTTGACAAAAAKAAAMLLRSAEPGVQRSEKIREVTIPFPDGGRARFAVHDSGFVTHHTRLAAWASVIKDAGDDPDVTHGAEIRAEITLSARCGAGSAEYSEIIIKGGKGVGIVTKPGLAMSVGEAAINPVPRKMILDAVQEAVREWGMHDRKFDPQSAVGIPRLEVVISVPQGEELAKKTLNHRLGIVGGISILGTTGIVKPLSEAAWTATITSTLNVAKALGREEVVLSTGRTSEKAHQKKFGLPDDCYTMMGDYTEFSLRDAGRHGFRMIHLCAQWAKMIKIAMATPQTHVRHGVLEVNKAVELMKEIGFGALFAGRRFNTVREMYDYVHSEAKTDEKGLFTAVCLAARKYCEDMTAGIPVCTHLVSYEGVIIAESE